MKNEIQKYRCPCCGNLIDISKLGNPIAPEGGDVRAEKIAELLTTKNIEFGTMPNRKEAE